jgi:hypothetical protein
MSPYSTLITTLERGLVLDVTLDELHFTAYVVISEADLDRIAEFVPAEQFEKEGDVHVTAVGRPGDAREQVTDLTFNMNPGDTAIFMCADEAAWIETLEELGHRTVDGIN